MQYVPTGLLARPTSLAEPQTERIRLMRPNRERSAELVRIGLSVSSTLDHLDDPDGSPATTFRDVVHKARGEM